MGVERNDRELVASRNGVDLAASRNGALILSPGGRPHPRLWVTPDDYELSTVDLGAGSGATFHWDWGTATSGTVTLPDGTEITDLSRRSHLVRAFTLRNGHYDDSTATLVARNASGAAAPVSKTLVRYWPVNLTVATRGLGQFPQPSGNVVTEYALDISLVGKPFPTSITISPSGAGPGGLLTNHQLQRFFDNVALNPVTNSKALTGGHAVILRRVNGTRELVRYTITAISYRRDGRELSRDVATFSLQWN